MIFHINSYFNTKIDFKLYNNFLTFSQKSCFFINNLIYIYAQIFANYRRINHCFEFSCSNRLLLKFLDTYRTDRGSPTIGKQSYKRFLNWYFLFNIGSHILLNSNTSRSNRYNCFNISFLYINPKSDYDVVACK